MKYTAIIFLMLGLTACGVILPPPLTRGPDRCIMPVCNLPNAQYYPELTMTVPCCLQPVRPANCYCRR